MGRLKKDHSNWKTQGLFKKYQQPAVVERKTRIKTHKDTQHWCRGKIGVAHDLYQKQLRYKWLNEITNHYYTYCRVCHKQLFKKRLGSVPLIIDVQYIQQESEIKPRYY
jgi:hypothetical protein